MASRTLYVTRAMQKGMAIMATGVPAKMSLSEMIETALHYSAIRLVDGDARMDKFGAEPDAFFEIKDVRHSDAHMLALEDELSGVDASAEIAEIADIKEAFFGDVVPDDVINSYEFVMTSNARDSLNALMEAGERTEEHIINQALEFARSEGSTFSKFMALED